MMKLMNVKKTSPYKRMYGKKYVMGKRDRFNNYLHYYNT